MYTFSASAATRGSQELFKTRLRENLISIVEESPETPHYGPKSA
jgi:hypothetical protein